MNGKNLEEANPFPDMRSKTFLFDLVNQTGTPINSTCKKTHKHFESLYNITLEERLPEHLAKQVQANIGRRTSNSWQRIWSCVKYVGRSICHCFFE